MVWRLMPVRWASSAAEKPRFWRWAAGGLALLLLPFMLDGCHMNVTTGGGGLPSRCAPLVTIGSEMTPEERERYSRQILFAGLGEEGQERLLRGHAAIVGCGALGSFQAAALARAGVGRLTIIDRDY